MNYSFTENDLAKAAAEWGCNCGPAAMAFALQRRLNVARLSIPAFEVKRYTSPTMMKKALASLGVEFEEIDCKEVRDPRLRKLMCDDFPALVRIQWTGPWTQPGANPRWAYSRTHWIVAWMDSVRNHTQLNSFRKREMIFDCNSGIVEFDHWTEIVVPKITACYKNADPFGWYPTHIWRLLNKPQEAAT